MAHDALSRGARALKVKVGLDLATDLDRVCRVRGVLGEGSLCVDANEGWMPDDPGGLADRLRSLDLAGIEQPYPRAAVAQTAALRAGLSAALVADESVWGERDLVAEETAEAFTEVSLYPGKVGGLRRCVRLAGLARERGLPVSYGSNLELGVGAAAMAHAMAVTPGLSERVPSDLIGPLYFESPLITDAGFVTYAGAALPAGPGLGVAFDPDAVAAHRIA
jgi:muconate cycloisomerase